MNVSRGESSRLRPLAVLGISADEELVYRALLTGIASTAEEVARSLALPLRKVQRLLDAIEARALATHSPERPRRYIAASPELAVEALIHRGQAHLERARAAIPELKQQRSAAAVVPDHDSVVELITNRDAERQNFERMHQLARKEVVSLVRPPLRVSRLDIPCEEDQHYQTLARARGVRYRSIIDHDYLALPGAFEHVRWDIRAGEEIRVFPSLPLKLVVADRHIAFIPLTLEHADSPTLLVRPSALLDAFVALFESLWERATPLALRDDGSVSEVTHAAPVDADTDALLSLLAAGLNDKAIAHEVGISSATLSRRIADLMGSLDTRTRFQLGWRAALKAFPDRSAQSGRDA